MVPLWGWTKVKKKPAKDVFCKHGQEIMQSLLPRWVRWQFAHSQQNSSTWEIAWGPDSRCMYWVGLVDLSWNSWLHLLIQRMSWKTSRRKCYRTIQTCMISFFDLLAFSDFFFSSLDSLASINLVQFRSIRYRQRRWSRKPKFVVPFIVRSVLPEELIMTTTRCAFAW